MKKSVILAILGLSAVAVTSYGQGSVAFNTYTALGGTGILATFGNGPSIGTGIGSTFTGELLWSLTNPGDAASTALTANNALNPAWNVGVTGTFASPATVAVGYIVANNLNLTALQLSGATTIFCEVAAFNGTGYGVGSTYQGHSASFSVALAQGTTLPSGDQLDNMAPFAVFQTVPEPTTLALGGLGLAALLVARRKKA